MTRTIQGRPRDDNDKDTHKDEDKDKDEDNGRPVFPEICESWILYLIQINQMFQWHAGNVACKILMMVSS